MATTCNFGPIKDLRVRDICINGKIVIDSKCNVNANDVTANSICTNELIIKTPKIHIDVKYDDIVSFEKDVFFKDMPLVNVAYGYQNENLIIQPLSGPFNSMTIEILELPCEGILGPPDMVTGNIIYNPDITGIFAYKYNIDDICGITREVQQFICIKQPII